MRDQRGWTHSTVLGGGAIGIAIIGVISAGLALSGGGTFIQPDATNTGFTGTLTNQSGDITITTPNTVVSGLNLTGSIGIKADNVTITNNKITGQVYIGQGPHGGDSSDTLVTGTKVTHNEIIGSSVSGQSGVEDPNGTNDVVSFNNFHGWENCTTFWGTGAAGPGNPSAPVGWPGHNATNFKWLSNYCHGESAAGSPHYDGVEIYGMSVAGLIQGNTATLTVAPSAAPVNMTPTGHYDGTITVDHNWLTSVNCAYVILGDDGQGNTPIHAVVTNNILAPSTPSGFCSGTPSAFYFSLRNGNGSSTYTISGNTDSITGTVVGQSACRQASGVVQNCF